MFSPSTIITTLLRPTIHGIKQTRNIRPTFKINNEKVELCIDVRNFNKDEIRVRARPEYVIIEGKQETKSKTGFIVRQFVRKFKLPDGCNPKKMQSQLSTDGMLTITAQRVVCEPSFPCEINIPVSFSESKKDDKDDMIYITGVPDDKIESKCPPKPPENPTT